MALDEQRQRDMRIARKYGEYGDVYEADDELYGLLGMDLNTYFTLGPNPWASVEIVPHFSSDMFAVRRLEKLIEKRGLLEEYGQLLNAVGANMQSATVEQRCQALVDVPYTIPPPPPDPVVEMPPAAPPIAVPPDPVLVLPATLEEKPTEVEPKRDLPQLPDEWWLTYLPNEEVPVIFKDDNGEIERIEAIWASDNLFEIRQEPLRVNGVSVDDVIEVRWEEGDLTPIFDRLNEKSQFGTIRVNVKKLSGKSRRSLVEYLGRSIASHRVDGAVMVVSYYDYEAIAKLNFRGLDWEFADEKPGVFPDY